MVKGSRPNTQKRVFRNDNTVRYALVNKAFDGVNDTQDKVLMPYVPSNQLKKGTQLPEHDILNNDNDLDYSDSPGAFNNGLDGDCYFPPDGYDYDQHLRKIDERNLFVDPNAEVGEVEEAPTNVEEQQKTEMKKMTPEERAVFAAMDDAECLDDDGSSDDVFFDSLLHGGDGSVDDSNLLWGVPTVRETEDDRMDLMMTLQGGTSTPQDEAFDRLLEEEYAEDEIGDLEDRFSRIDMPIERATTIGGQTSVGAFLKRDKQNLDINACQDIIDDYIKSKEDGILYKQYDEKPAASTKDDRKGALEVTREMISRPEEEEKSVLVPVKERRKSDDWDCESVLSTLTNNTNHPGKINRPTRIRKPAMIPAPALATVEEYEEDEELSEDDEEELVEVSTYRPRDETPEEKRARKAAVKQLQREARKAKKETKATFKLEKLSCQRRGNAADIRDGVARVKL